MLKKITIENFRSYAQAEMSFGTGKLNVVIGDSLSDYSDSNGSGKSTLMYAVCWVLYGMWPGMKKADSAVRQPLGKDCLVEAVFNVHGHDYRIRRTRGHSKYNSSIWIDENTGDMKVMQEKIEQLVGMDYSTFCSTMIYTGHPLDSFANMTDNEQKKILRALLPVDLSQAQEQSKLALDESRRAHAKAMSEVDFNNGRMNQIGLRIEQQKAAVTELENKISSATADQTKVIEEIEKHRDRAEQENIEIRDRLTFVRRKYDDLVKLGPQWEESSKAWSLANDKAHHYSHVCGQIRTLEESVKQREMEGSNRLSRILAQAQEARGAQIQKCPACGSVVQDPEHLAKHYEEQAEQERRNNGISLSNDNNTLDKLRAEAETLRVPDTFDQQYADFKKQHDAFVADLRDTLAERDKLQQRLEEVDRYLYESEKEITNLKSQVTDKSRDVDAAKAVLGQMEKDGSEAAEAEIHLQESVHDAAKEMQLAENVALLFGSGKGSLRHFIFESALPELSATSQMFLRFLSDEQLSVSMKSHKQNGKKTIEGFFVEAEKAVSTGSCADLSGGEQRRIDLAIFLALNLIANKNVFPLKTIFLDEIADPLDETGQQKVVQLLQHVCAEYGINCLLLTNVKELVASTPTGYRCVMRDGISELTPFLES